MNTKTLLAALAGAVAAFLLGWLIFGNLLMPFYSSHTMQYEGLMKDMENPAASMLVLIFIANFGWTLAIAMVCSWSNMVGIMKGAVIGGTLGFLIQTSFDLFMYSTMNMYDGTLIIVDVVVNALFGAVIGAVIGWVMERGSNKAVAA